jgi:hypothetical protein
MHFIHHYSDMRTLFFFSDLHIDGVRSDPDFVGPELETDTTNDHLTEREQVTLYFFSRLPSTEHQHTKMGEDLNLLGGVNSLRHF